MNKIVVMNVPAHGHINPTIGLSRELVAQGDKVYYFADKRFAENFNFPGVEFRAVDFDALNRIISRSHGDILSMLPEVLQTSDQIIETHLEEIRAIDPDIILYDSTCFWGKDIASILKKPSIGSFTVFVFEKKILKNLKNFSMLSLPKMIWKRNVFKHLIWVLRFVRDYRKYRKKYNLPKKNIRDLFAIKSTHNLVYTVKAIHPFAELLDSSYSFIGPIVRECEENLPEYLNKMNSNKPTALISLGTVKNNNLSFFKLCIKTVKEMGINAVIACGDNFDSSSFGVLPDNIVVQPYVPQIQVLKKADLFITHGGMNSTHEGLSFGVPLLFIPQQEEQRLVASQVVERKAGILLDEKNLSITELKHAIDAVLYDPVYKENAEKMAFLFHQAGGAKAGAAVITNAIKKFTHKESLLN